MKHVKALLLNAESADKNQLQCEVVVFIQSNIEDPEKCLYSCAVVNIKIPDMPDQDIAPAAEMAAVRYLIWEKRATNPTMKPEVYNGHPLHGKNTTVFFSNDRPKQLMKVLWERATARETRDFVQPPREWEHIGKYSAKLMASYEQAIYDVLSDDDVEGLAALAQKIKAGDELPFNPDKLTMNAVFDAGVATRETHSYLPLVASEQFKAEGLHISTMALNEYRMGILNEKRKLIKLGMWKTSPDAPTAPALERLAKYLKKFSLIELPDQYNFRAWIQSYEERLDNALAVKVYAQSMNRSRGMNYFFVATTPTLNGDELKHVVVGIKFLYDTDIERRAKEVRQAQNQRAYELGMLPKEYLDLDS